jgi:hypothetical protein
MIWHQRSAGQQRPAFGTGGVRASHCCMLLRSYLEGGGGEGVTAKVRGGEGGRARESICSDNWVLQQLHGEVPECADANEAGAGGYTRGGGAGVAVLG